MDRRETFSAPEDRLTYLRLLAENVSDAQAAILAYCLMSNHVHLIALPACEDSLAVLLRRAHGRYAQYYNTRWGRSGHLWQNRFFACLLEPDQLWTAVSYVERNPVRAGLAVRPQDYPWSSAAAHLTGVDHSGILDMEWWRRHGPQRPEESRTDPDDQEKTLHLRRCTYSGRPYGTSEFVAEMSRRFGRYWTPGRPPKKGSKTGAPMPGQLPLFPD